MKKISLLTITVAVSLMTFTAAFASPQSADKPKVKRSELIKQSMMRRFGGLVKRPDSYRGRIVIANAGKVPAAEINAVIKDFQKNINIRIEGCECEKPDLFNAGEMRRKIGAEAVLFIIDDKKAPTLLTAPEEHWVIVNIARLGENASDEAVVKRRIRCEIARGLAYLSGAAGSTFPNSLMTSITSPRGLDFVSDEMPPMEVFSRMPNYLKGIGITPLVIVPYSIACEEGWAPAPTNEYQKAICDKVYATPKNPMKIEFDPKKGR
jgi:hypothetical protein